MLKYTVKRLAQSLVTILLIATIVFLLMRCLPTDYYFTEEQLMKFTEEQKYAALEGELEKAMNEQSDVETQLADPAVYADGARSTELLKRFNELRDLTERLMEDMAALEEQIAAIEARRADIDSMGDLA
jgi:ABC-type microcin C transport system permease subunit YejB